eukprot:GEMP01052231.1.p1 GENE.GEMP01052231.1~~GEMP01052231.1.p1  ORF type:complete len:270 (+),score=47.78 GEMP01052231.1:72-812(+)
MALHDVAASGTASFFVSPIVTTIDKAIISNASGRQKLMPCMKENFSLLAARPDKFLALREFRLIWGVYWATYASANLTDTVCKDRQISAIAPVLLVTTAVNMTTCIWKDKEFTRMFGTIAAKSVPKMTYLLFAIRDSLTILASFTIVPFVAKALEERNIRPFDFTPRTTAQLTCPMAVQVFSTPLHLLGLDLYNRPDVSAASRTKFVGCEYIKSAAARMFRILPAFGIGGVGNTYFREKYKGYFAR